MRQKEIRTPRGLYTHPSKIAVPEGALVTAENCFIYREGIVSKRRGFARYGNELPNVGSHFLLYQEALLLYSLVDSKISYDAGGGVWTPYTLSVSPPSAGLRLPWLEQNRNLYFGTSAGVYTTDNLTTEPVRAGTPPALDLTASLVGTGDGFFFADTSVGYRLSYTHVDANQNAKEGYPSFPEILSNPTFEVTWTRAGTVITVTHTAHGYLNGDAVRVIDSNDQPALPDGTYIIQSIIDPNTYTLTGVNDGGLSGTFSAGKDFNVQLTFTLPDGLVVGDTYRLYRTALSGASADPAGDDMQEILSGKLTSSDLATGSVTVIDTFDDAFRGVRLYSGPNAEGPSQANSRPPWCEFMANYGGHTFYGVYRSEEAVQLQLLGTGLLVSGTSKIFMKLGASTLSYTFDSTENATTHKAKLFTSFETEAENVRETAKSLVRVINKDSTNDWLYAFYNSTETDSPGKILLQSRGVNVGTFTVYCDDDATTGPSFSPALPESLGTPAVNSDSSFSKSGLRRSKFQQPEAVPAFNVNQVGAANKKLLGMAALKDVLLIFKEDGVFTLSGTTDGAGGFTFTVDELDPTIILNAPNSLVTLDSAAFCATPKGVVKVSQGGATIISRPIEDDLRKIFHFSGYSTKTHGIAYESENLYIFYTQGATSDTVAEVGWAYNTITQSWSKYILKPCSAGIVPPLSDILYLVHGVDKYVVKERKTLTGTGADYVDESVPCTVTAVNTVTNSDGQMVTAVTVNFSYTDEPAEGWGFEKGSFSAVATVVNKVSPGVFVLTLSKYKPSLTTGAALLSIPVRMEVKWAPVDFTAQGAFKQFPFMTLTLEGAGGHHRLGAHSDLNSQPTFLPTIKYAGGFGWGEFSWGVEPWGSPGSGSVNVLRTWIPKNHQRARAFSPIYINSYVREAVNVLAVTLDYRFVGTRPERRP
jgi:hypothetical protein